MLFVSNPLTCVLRPVSCVLRLSPQIAESSSHREPEGNFSKNIVFANDEEAASALGTEMTELTKVGEQLGEPDHLSTNPTYPLSAVAAQGDDIQKMFGSGAATNEDNEENVPSVEIIAVPTQCEAYLCSQKKSDSKPTRDWDKVHLLRECHIFSSWNTSALYWLSVMSDEKTFNNHSTILDVNDVVPSIYFILEGGANYCAHHGVGTAVPVLHLSYLCMTGDIGGAVRDLEAKMGKSKIQNSKGPESSPVQKQVTHNAFNKRISFEKQSSLVSNASPQRQSTRTLRLSGGANHLSRQMSANLTRTTSSRKVSPTAGGLDVLQKAARPSFRKNPSYRTRASLIDRSNSLVKLVPHEYRGGVVRGNSFNSDGGDSSSEKEMRKAISSYHFVSSPYTRILIIPVHFFSTILSLLPPTTIQIVVDLLLAMVRKQSEWYVHHQQPSKAMLEM